MATGTKDYYKTLGVTEKASQAEIKSAYRILAKKYHPDAKPGPKARPRCCYCTVFRHQATCIGT